MAYENYIPTIETKKMLKERDKHLVFVANTTREWEGEIKSRGDHIKINGIGSPTVWTLRKDGTYEANQALTAEGKPGTTRAAGSGKDVIHRGIPDWEEVETYSIQLPVNQEAVWNYGVGDLDQQMMTEKGMVAKLRSKHAVKLADIQDRYVAKLMANFTPAAYSPDVVTVTSEKTPESGKNILKLINDMVRRLHKNNVLDSEQLYCECSPDFWMVLKDAYTALDTNNSELLANRGFGKYNGIIFNRTNNAIVDGQDYIYLHTKSAVAFFDPITKNEAYRPQNGFADCVKGFSWFDAGIVDKNALLVAKVTY